MSHSYIEYHGLIASFVTGQYAEEPLSNVMASNLASTISPSANHQQELLNYSREERMKLAFINALREEMQEASAPVSGPDKLEHR